MKRWAELCSRGVRHLFGVVASFALWTLWLGLVVLLVAQLYILQANELALPGFVLRQLEARFAESGLRASFARTSFDPTGVVVIEDVRLSPLAFDEPVVTARALFIRLNPLWLSVGKVELREARLADVTVAVPAILSPSGRAEPIVTQLDATLELSGREVMFRQLSARIAGVAVSAHGRLMLQPSRDRHPVAGALGDFMTHRFGAVCRQALAVAQQVSQFEAPSLQIEFSPSESGAATIHLLALARSARVANPVALEATGLVASTRFLVFGDAPASDIEVSAAEVKGPAGWSAREVKARLLGRVRIEGSQFDPRELAVTADAIAAPGLTVDAVSAHVFSRGFPRFETRAIGSLFGAPFALTADTDFGPREGAVRFDAQVSPRVLDLVSQRTGANVRRFFDFESLATARGDVRLGANWKFEKLTARVRVPQVMAYGVALQDGRVTVELDPHRFYAPEAFARVGPNFARGSYEQDLKTQRYRFLLDGQLRPLDISPWFREWWSNFFAQFEFPAVPPSASVDVQNVWRDGRHSNVFVFADAPQVTYRGLAFDRVRTRLFIRPAFFDGLEINAVRGPGAARGHFTYAANPATNAWRTLDLGIDSNLDLAVVSQLIGPVAARTLAPFRVGAPPRVNVSGRFVGPDAAPDATKLRIQARTTGDFRFHDFPLQDVSFLARVDRDDIALDDVSGRFAGGVVNGHARVWGAREQRRVGFDFALEEASLGQVAAEFGEFLARRQGRPSTPPGKFIQEKASVKLNLAASAEGPYDNLLGYRGEGNAFLHGPGLGEVQLFGLLSELLKFTALRFTEARTNFRIEGNRLVFPTVTLRGANSAIDAHGSYALDTSLLDFNAKILPFQESDNLIKTVVGAVLSPLSNALEVKLTGSPTKPNWAFVMGPTNLLRSLAPGGDAPAKPENAATEKAPPNTPVTGEKPVNPPTP